MELRRRQEIAFAYIATLARNGAFGTLSENDHGRIKRLQDIADTPWVTARAFVDHIAALTNPNVVPEIMIDDDTKHEFALIIVRAYLRECGFSIDPARIHRNTRRMAHRIDISHDEACAFTRDILIELIEEGCVSLPSLTR